MMTVIFLFKNHQHNSEMLACNPLKFSLENSLYGCITFSKKSMLSVNRAVSIQVYNA